MNYIKVFWTLTLLATTTLSFGQYTGGQGDGYANSVAPVYASISTIKPVLELNIMPNPTASHISIVLEEAGFQTYDIVVYNVSGQLVQQHLDTNLQTIDVSKLPKGVYTLSVSSNTNYYTAQFVKH